MYREVFLIKPISTTSVSVRELIDKTRVYFRAGLHDNVPDLPSAKVAPVGCQMATMALKIKTVSIPEGGLHGRSGHPVWDLSVSGPSCTRQADFLPLWE